MRRFAILLLAGVVAGCGTKPIPAPVVVVPPAPACKAAEAVAIAFKDILPPLAGKCIKTRGLVVRSLLYENGASLARLSGPPGRAPIAVVSLIWQGDEPPALKSHPQFLEFVGRVMACTPQTNCIAGAPLGLVVSDFKIIPTAMD